MSSLHIGVEDYIFQLKVWFQLIFLWKSHPYYLFMVNMQKLFWVLFHSEKSFTTSIWLIQKLDCLLMFDIQ